MIYKVRDLVRVAEVQSCVRGLMVVLEHRRLQQDPAPRRLRWRLLDAAVLGRAPDAPPWCGVPGWPES